MSLLDDRGFYHIQTTSCIHIRQMQSVWAHDMLSIDIFSSSPKQFYTQ